MVAKLLADGGHGRNDIDGGIEAGDRMTVSVVGRRRHQPATVDHGEHISILFDSIGVAHG